MDKYITINNLKEAIKAVKNEFSGEDNFGVAINANLTKRDQRLFDWYLRWCVVKEFFKGNITSIRKEYEEKE